MFIEQGIIINYYESGDNKLILSFVINSILKNKDKSLKEKFTKWLIDVANINKDLTKIGNTIQTQSFTSVSTLDCLYNLVLELFMNAGKKLEQYIDLSYIRYDNCPLFIGNDERLDTSFELIQYEQDDENVTTKPSFLTILHYLVYSYYKLTTVYYINRNNKLKKDLEQIKLYITNLNSMPTYLRNLYAKTLEKSCSIMKEQIKVYSSLLKSNKNIHLYCNYIVNWILESMKYHDMPISILEDIDTTLNFFISKENSNLAIFDNNFNYKNVFKLIRQVVINIKNPYTKAGYIRIANKMYDKFTFLIPELSVADSRFIEHLYTFYIDFLRISSTWNSQERFIIKFSILHFINIWMFNITDKHLYDSKESKDVFSKFIYSLMGDVIKVNDTTSDYYEYIEENFDSFGQEKVKEIILKNNSNKYIQGVFLLLYKYCNMHLNYLEIIMEDNILEKIVMTMNYTFNKNSFEYIKKYPRLLSVCPDIVFDVAIYEPLIECYNNLSDPNNSYNEKFIKYVIMDDRCFKLSEFKNYCESRISNEYTKQKTLDFIVKCEIEKEIIEKNKEIEIEYPDEFYDPIMDCVIVEPVFLPSSNTMMEKTVIEKHLLTSDIDPFTRDKLTLETLTDYNNLEEIQQKIKEFIQKKKDFENSAANKPKK